MTLIKGLRRSHSFEKLDNIGKIKAYFANFEILIKYSFSIIIPSTSLSIEIEININPKTNSAHSVTIIKVKMWSVDTANQCWKIKLRNNRYDGKDILLNCIIFKRRKIQIYSLTEVKNSRLFSSTKIVKVCKLT